jgi:hypothetical protein
MIRRNFLRGLLGLFAAAPAAQATIPSFGRQHLDLPWPKEEPEKSRVFRHDGNGWQEISWLDIRKGDKIIEVGIFAGKLTTIDLFRAVRDVSSNDQGIESVETDYIRSILPDPDFALPAQVFAACGDGTVYSVGDRVIVRPGVYDAAAGYYPVMRVIGLSNHGKIWCEYCKDGRFYDASYEPWMIRHAGVDAAAGSDHSAVFVQKTD